jgi:diguanylate cyclase
MYDDKDSIYDKIVAIHDEVMEVLKVSHIPPYPTQYQKQFNRTFDSLSDNILKNALNQDCNMDDKINSIAKYIEFAKIAIENFSSSHLAIANVAAQQNDLLVSYHNSPEKTEGNHVSVIDGLMALGVEMVKELQSSEDKITALNTQLDDSMLEVSTDPLTHLLNHRKYLEDLSNILSNGHEHALPIVFLMINGDDFKKINDSFGHTAGDKVLYFLAQTIKGMVRAGDTVYRYSGDQFAIIVNRCNKEQAMGVAEKILHKVEHSNLIYAGKTIELTISIGATIHIPNDDIDSVIKRSQDALIKSKNEGKNRITLI